MGLATITKKPDSTEKPKRQNSKFKHLMLLHWVMASLLMLLYLTGVYVAHPPQAHSVKWLSPFLHQSVGKLFLLLLVARIVLLLRVVRSKYFRRLPNVTPNWLKTVTLHTILYFFMLIVPVSGFLLLNFKGVSTTFFGISVPLVFAANSGWVGLARNSHFWTSYIFLAFISLHMLVHWKVLRSHFRRLFPVSPLSHQPTQPTESAAWRPAIELTEEVHSLVLRAQLPGLEAKDLDVEVTHESVSIAGELHEQKAATDQVSSEFWYGKFRRVVSLPAAIQSDRVQADYKDGILTLTLPKVAELSRKVVKVSLVTQA